MGFLDVFLVKPKRAVEILEETTTEFLFKGSEGDELHPEDISHGKSPPPEHEYGEGDSNGDTGRQNETIANMHAKTRMTDSLKCLSISTSAPQSLVFVTVN